jgi:hypothetical protein
MTNTTKENKSQYLLLYTLLNQDTKIAIPPYQRAYEWTRKNMAALLDDLDEAVTNAKLFGGAEYRYRLGSIILEDTHGPLYVVDGQQRLTSITLLYYYLHTEGRKRAEINPLPKIFENASNSLSARDFLEKSLGVGDATEAADNEAIEENYKEIRAHYAAAGKEHIRGLSDLLQNNVEVVVLCVHQIKEAFQLFDSQNARGKNLYGHHILKAHHLRAMGEDEFRIEYAVEKWEKHADKDIKYLFEQYLYPIFKWSHQEKVEKDFSADDIDIYKGIPANTTYPFGQRVLKSMPVFQLTQPVAAGNDFFEMVNYYLTLCKHIEKIADDFLRQTSILTTITTKRKKPKNILILRDNSFYLRMLFQRALLLYYDRFNELSDRAKTKLALWAFTPRVKYKSLQWKTVQNYAIEPGRAFFAAIARAQKPSEVLNWKVTLPDDPKDNTDANDKELFKILKKWNGEEGV